MSGGEFRLTLPDFSEQEATVTRLAERLGVKPGGPPGYTLAGADGKLYNMIALAQAFLDKMEKAKPETAALLEEAYNVINVLLNFMPDGLGSFDGTAMTIARDRACVFLHKVGKRDTKAGRMT